MTLRSFCQAATAALLVALLAACATMPPPTLSRAQPRPSAPAGAEGGVDIAQLEEHEGPRAQIRRGSGEVINRRQSRRIVF